MKPLLFCQKPETPNKPLPIAGGTWGKRRKTLSRRDHLVLWRRPLASERHCLFVTAVSRPIKAN